MKANENKAAFMPKDKAWEDRKLFVENLGELLSQTREGVVSCELKDNEIVVITFKGGHTKEVNVNYDSYLAIIKDVCKWAF